MMERVIKRILKLPDIDGLDCKLWLLDYSEIENYELVLAKKVLTTSEFRRCEKYQLHDLKAHFILSRLLIKSLLAKELSCKVGEIELQYSELGKPYLAAHFSGCHFSYSDSQALGLFGMCTSGEIGVDLEIIDNNVDVLETLSVIASPAEKHWVLETNSLERYYLLWTLKESYVKCLGTGLQGPLPEVSSILQRPLGAVHRLNGDESIQMYSNFYNNNYIYSLSKKI